MLNELLTRYYDLETKISVWSDNAQYEAIRSWLKNLDTTIEFLRHMTVEQLKRQFASGVSEGNRESSRLHADTRI